LFAALLISLGGLATNTPKTAQAEGTNSDFNFVAAGDWGCQNDAKNTFSMMKKMEPELYLALGDFSYEPTLDCWSNIVNSAGPALKVAVGNHDTEGSVLRTLMNKFNLDREYYSFDYGNTHFLAMSSELNDDTDMGQYNFVKLDLSKARSNPLTDWIIVYFHRPFYSGSGSEDSDLRDMYQPLFENYGVDLVLTGHAHNYQRSYPLNYNINRPDSPLIADHQQSQYNKTTGIVFAIVGTGGESIQSVDKKPYLANIYEGFGCLNVEINGKTLSAEFYTDKGNTIDHFEIIKDKINHESVDADGSLQRVAYHRPLHQLE